MYLGGDQRQTHAVQVAALFTEDKVLLLGFRNDELELDLLAQHGRAEGERMEGALRQLKACTHTRALGVHRSLPSKKVKLSNFSRFGRACMRVRNYTVLTCAAGPASQ